ncbi:MAG: hypothetical protein HYS51_01865 [Candidatus Zambryskibacteria bacterium]|nr:hypothetical protein [Candidatus Zambryskibacteria bacterium]
MEHRHFSHYSESQEIALRLESYDDIFSDFDNRPYSKRALSVDFLDEVERASRDKKEGNVELILSVPKEKREESHDQVIRERLHSHFNKHYKGHLNEKRRVLQFGCGMVILGIISMIAATIIVFEDPTKNIWLSFLVVFLEPAAWFLLWEGMDQIIFNSRNIQHKLDFYRKMSSSHGHIHFQSY